MYWKRWFDGKNVEFSVKIVIAFLMTFPHCEHFWILQNWFHVKLEWQKNCLIFLLNCGIPIRLSRPISVWFFCFFLFSCTFFFFSKKKRFNVFSTKLIHLKRILRSILCIIPFSLRSNAIFLLLRHSVEKRKIYSQLKIFRETNLQQQMRWFYIIFAEKNWE